MKLVDINWKPTDHQLRQFGAAAAVALPLVIAIWSHGHWRAVASAAAIGAALALIGWVYPRALKPLFVGLTLVALPIGMVVGELAMLIIFFGVVMPTGLLLRLLGRDHLKLRLDRGAATYWQRKRQPKSAASYFRQFS